MKRKEAFVTLVPFSTSLIERDVMNVTIKIVRTLLGMNFRYLSRNYILPSVTL